MHFRNLLQYSVAGSVSLLAFTAAAQAADITITNAEIAGGKLVITGTTATANTRVRLDGKTGAGFNVTSNGSRAFSLSLAYLPSGCVVSLQKVNPTGLGAPNEAVVANCGRGLSPRGPWSAAADYSSDDIVTYQNSSWLARRDSTGSPPKADADWQLFAQVSGDGSDGSPGDASDDAAQRVPPTGAAGGDLAGSYPNPTIRNLAVTAAKINNGAVNTLKIADSAVTAAKINSGAVNTTKIADNGVTNSDIADDAVTARNLGDLSVGASKLQNDSVTSLKIADAAVTARTIFDGAVRTQEVKDDTFADGGLQAVDLRADSVGSSEIQSGAVGSDEIADGSVHAAEINPDAFFSGDISLDGGTTYQITTGGVDSSDLASGAVSGVKLGTITDVSAVSATIAANGNGSVTATCPAGSRIVSGGNDGFFDVFVVASRVQGNGWEVFGHNSTASTRTITAHAYCLL